jgi:HD superfamily phosphohydrolase
MPQKIVNFLQCRPKRCFYNDILCSQLDADRFDYLLRDNLMTGSGYGGYDLVWLLHALTIDQATSQLAVTWKGISAVEAYLQARYHMYRNVYFHKVVRSAEGMLRLALQRAKRLAVQDRLEWPHREDAVYKALVGQALSTREFLELDDVAMLQCFTLWQKSEDSVLANLCRGLLFRRLYKSIDLTHLPAEEARARFKTAERVIAAAGGDPAYELFYDEPADTPYELNGSVHADAPREILVQDANGQLVEFAALSAFSRSLNQQLMFRRVHFAESWKALVGEVVGG